MKKNHYFLKYLNGKWSTQERVLIFKSKRQKVFDVNLHFHNLYINKKILKEKRILINKINNDCRNLLLIRDQSLNKNQKIFLLIQSLDKALLNFIKLSNKSNLSIRESIYVVNKNIMISIVIILNNYGKYLGVKISSHIRLT